MARAVVKFDLSSIPKNAKIVSAELSIYTGTVIDNNQYPAAKHLVGTADRKWSEETLTWFTIPELIRAQSLAIPGWTKQNRRIVTNFLSEVQDMVSGKMENNGFVIAIGNKHPKRFTIQIHASESDIAEKRPALLVKYVEQEVPILNTHINDNLGLNIAYDGLHTFTLNGMPLSQITASVFTFSGEKLLEKELILTGLSNTFSMPVSHLAEGTYIITITSGGKNRKAFQFIKR